MAQTFDQFQLSLEQLKGQRSAILAQMTQAEAEVRFADGRAVTYRPIADLRAALERLDIEIARLQSQSSQFTLQTSRGI